MAQAVQRTKKEFEGPLLLDRQDVLALDKILASEWETLEAARVKVLDEWIAAQEKRYQEKGYKLGREQIRERAPYRLEKSDRKYVIELANGVTYKSDSLADCVNEIHNADQRPVSINATLDSGPVSVVVDIASGTLFSGRKVSVEPPDNEHARRIFAEVSTWFDERRPAPVVRLFKFLSSVAMVALVAIALVFLYSNIDRQIVQAQKEEAHALLKDGLSESEMPEAIELLLRSNYSIPADDERGASQTPKLKWWEAFGLLMLLLTAATAVMVPDVVIGVGQAGRSRLALSRWWIKYVCYGVPALIGTAIIVPWIWEVFSSIARGNP